MADERTRRVGRSVLQTSDPNMVLIDLFHRWCPRASPFINAIAMLFDLEWYTEHRTPVLGPRDGGRIGGLHVRVPDVGAIPRLCITEITVRSYVRRLAGLVRKEPHVISLGDLAVIKAEIATRVVWEYPCFAYPDRRGLLQELLRAIDGQAEIASRFVSKHPELAHPEQENELLRAVHDLCKAGARG